LNLEKKDLAKILGNKSPASEILAHKRRLTLPMIRNLHNKLNIPYKSLMGYYKTKERKESTEDMR